MTDYLELERRLTALIHGVPHFIANLANASALLFDTLEEINWAGFYHMEQGRLVLGPFQGKPACIEIPLNKGVCGAAASKGETVLVKNVHEFPGHIACDSASNSEIVLPLYRRGKLWGVLDIDSPLFCRFTQEDERELAVIAELLGGMLSETE